MDTDTAAHVEAERALIGAVLLSPRALDDAIDILTPADCYEPRHELILTAAITLSVTGRRADTVTVADQLGADLARAGGLPYLNELVAGVVTATNAAHHADIVKTAATIRAVRATGTRLAAATDDTDPLELIDAARANLDRLATTNTADMPHAQAVYEAIDSLDAPPGLPTPWRSLTHALAGWKPGSLTIIGARPSVGKSVFGSAITLDSARRGSTSLLFSYEMPHTEITLRMLSNIGSVSHTNIQHRQLTTRDETNLAEAAAHLADLPMTIRDRPGMTVAQIRSHVRAAQRTGDELGPVVIDYLQLIKPPAGITDRRVQVDTIARSLKELAMELKVPIVALAQLNRGPEARVDKTPSMSDLRESGELEQAADNILLLHRDTLGRDADPSDMRVIVPKARHGSPTQLQLVFAGHYARLTEPRWTPSAPIERNAS